MLVLSRKESERLVFPTLGVSVEVVRIQGKKARLGIDAPPDVPVLRQEMLDLKSLEFAPDEETSSHKLAALTKVVQQKLDSSAQALNLLHEHLDNGDHAAQSLVLDVFRELRNLEREVNEIVADEATGQTAHALLIDNDPNERELLASCLRLGGFEVDVASDTADALGYLSLHAAPDFALVGSVPDDAVLIDALRSEAGDAMKLFGLGLHANSVDRSFPRPINAERLVDALAREFGVAV